MALDAVRGGLDDALGWIVLVTEMLAVLVLLGGITRAFVAGVRSGHPAIDARTRFRAVRRRLGHSLLLALELLVVADILRTIAIEMTLRSLGILGALVVIRTFVSFAVEVEIEGTLPWRRGGDEANEATVTA